MLKLFTPVRLTDTGELGLICGYAIHRAEADVEADVRTIYLVELAQGHWNEAHTAFHSVIVVHPDNLEPVA